MTLVNQLIKDAYQYDFLDGHHISRGMETIVTRVGRCWYLVVWHEGSVLGYHPLGWWDNIRLTWATSKMKAGEFWE